MKHKKIYMEERDQRRIERLLLAIYLFHTLCLFLTIIIRQWSFHTLIPLVIGAPVILYIYKKKCRTYVFRACVTSTVFWINLTIYALFVSDFISILTSISAIVILMALYGLPDVIFIGNIFYTIMVLFHLFSLRDVALSFAEVDMRSLMRIFFIYFIEGIVYYLVKLQQSSNRRLFANIDSLRRAEQSKDDFLANVSHEIRTPVNTICGMSEIILQGDLPDETRDYMFGIQTSGRNLLSIVSDILDFSELESGDVSILQEPYSITSVINDIINTANAKNSEKNLELIVDCDPNMPSMLIGDRQRICRVMTNLLDNAIKFTEEGGVILTISTRQEAYGANLCVTIRDTGIGIQPELLEKIFTSFNQADTRRNRAGSGIGLGLAISKSIVDKMGGFLKIQSVYGEGTEVSVVIPQKIEDKSPCISVKNPENLRVLVYMHFDKYKYPLLRESSQTAVKNMAQRFEVSAYACRNLSELKRRVEGEEFTHLFIGWDEYCEDRAWFEKTAHELQVTLIIDRKFQQNPPGSPILCINAPLYALSIASILNGETVRELADDSLHNHFTAPDVHVLVVDDNLMNLKVVEGLLRPYKLKISVAQSGQEALKKLENQIYDFVFMDHMMPEMDGVETFYKIREKKGAYYQNLPIIALTANAVGNAREMFLSEGFADYVSKPIEMSAMEHVLHKFIPREKMVYAGREITPIQPRTPKPPKKPGADDPVPGFLENGIDAALGIGFCGGSLEDYLEIVRVYYGSGERNIRSIRNACTEGDWKQFILLTHTVKSTSKSIGANKLSELSAGLEAAGKEGDFSNITERTEEMLAEYARVLRVLAENETVFPEKPEPPAGGRSEKSANAKIPSNAGAETTAFAGTESEAKSTVNPGKAVSLELSRDDFAACCRELSERLSSFDGDAVMEFMDGLQGHYGGAVVAELLQPIRDLANDFDFMGAEDELSRLMEKEKLL